MLIIVRCAALVTVNLSDLLPDVAAPVCKHVPNFWKLLQIMPILKIDLCNFLPFRMFAMWNDPIYPVLLVTLSYFPKGNLRLLFLNASFLLLSFGMKVQN